MNRREFVVVATSTLTGCAGILDDDARTDTGPTDGGRTDRSGTDTTTTDPDGTTPGGTTSDPGPSIGLEPLAEGLDFPVAVVESSERPGRRYIAEREGFVRVGDPDRLRSEPLIDLRDQVVTGGERGLLGLALHPEFGETRRLFVRYSSPSREGTPDGYSHTFVLAEFAVNSDGLRADPESERSLLEIPQPDENHNAGDLAFGPDGYLYVPTGDGGHGDDRGPGHVQDWYDGTPGGNGQDVTENLLGSILRIDVDSEGDDRPYGIPEDNPLVGQDGLDEHYAWGFRNPWRLSFDGEDLFVGDVGQRRWEEINLVERGGNYGWNVKEGAHCFGVDAHGVESCPDATPKDVRGGESLLDPVVEYPNWKHARSPVSGAAVICGYMYRGSTFPNLDGRFVFTDWAARGRLFVATPVDGGRWRNDVIAVVKDDRNKLFTATCFGCGPDGELSVLTTREDGTGGLYRLVAAD